MTSRGLLTVPPPRIVGVGPERIRRGASATGDALGTAALCIVAFLAAESPSWAMSYGGPLACAAVILTSRLPHLRAPDLFALVTAGWAYATRLWTVDAAYSSISAPQYASACLVFLAVRHVVRSTRQILAIGCAYLLGCVTAVDTVMRHASSGVALARDNALDYSVRFGVDGVNYNYTAYTFVTGALIALVLVRLRPSPRAVRVCLLACLPVLALGVLLNGTKGATIALALAAVYLPLSVMAPRSMRVFAGVTTPVLLVLVPLGVFSDAWMLWFDDLFGRRTGDLSGRLEIWPVALSSWLEAPITGIGAGGFAAFHGIGPHTLLLTLGNDLGLVGMVLYAGTFATALAAPLVRSVPPIQRLAGLFLIALLPIWLTGHWESSQGAWILLGLLSRLQPQHLDDTYRKGVGDGDRQSPPPSGISPFTPDRS
ncbi:O-antigen ligase family protein [Micromonospora sp. NPDC018662]|uniref:O-antigen ligase family protein n=1 Tax=Micromonospora sp. NPDC018662 TaxID=3364238 RepID=UPI0037887326